MTALLDAVQTLVALVSEEKVRAIATRVRKLDSTNAKAALQSEVSARLALSAVDGLANAWKLYPVQADELAGILIGAAHAHAKARAEQQIELVWTGPTTPFVSPRRTEQALLEVINAAEQSLFLTSFVAYQVPSIVSALNAACQRGVVVSILLESSLAHGGSIDIDVIGKMKMLVPDAKIFAWTEKGDGFIDGRVHAKVAVADGRLCFITSANLTGFAMEKNMEAGVLVFGGSIPSRLNDHLQSLAHTYLICPVT